MFLVFFIAYVVILSLSKNLGVFFGSFNYVQHDKGGGKAEKA